MTLRISHLGQTGYLILDGNKPITGVMGRRYIAEARMEKILKARCAKVRTCLRCRRGFDSEGPHDRLCDPCGALDMGLGA